MKKIKQQKKQLLKKPKQKRPIRNLAQDQEIILRPLSKSEALFSKLEKNATKETIEKLGGRSYILKTMRVGTQKIGAIERLYENDEIDYIQYSAGRYYHLLFWQTQSDCKASLPDSLRGDGGLANFEAMMQKPIDASKKLAKINKHLEKKSLVNNSKYSKSYQKKVKKLYSTTDRKYVELAKNLLIKEHNLKWFEINSNVSYYQIKQWIKDMLNEINNCG